MCTAPPYCETTRLASTSVDSKPTKIVHWPDVEQGRSYLPAILTFPYPGMAKLIRKRPPAAAGACTNPYPYCTLSPMSGNEPGMRTG
ncbi:hypothetical protein HBI80_096540 [Parastagonospora nodorum]|nr:hypothetical protein HBI80_096540 [Parastagonospora nodorum]KAH5337787.1 hypothetical protein HBI12_019460 [Parastagonospora nodorum]KAH5447032.1 hypothetical protein HBI47_020250 [Parastagonospora nodorum]KAH6311514.1 hypothetical protein HBI39_063150 [Parastagonospora nodorum]